MSKDLKEKAVDIKGKKYVLVSDRIIFFNDTYKKGMIQTKLVSYEGKKIVMQAKVTPEVTTPDRYFTGWSQEVEGDGMVNKTSALENAETSAVGRALAMMGIGVIDSIASIDEINKATNRGQVSYTPVDQSKVDGKKCEACGADMRMSKAGKPYCSALCWKKTTPDKKVEEPIVDPKEVEAMLNEEPFK